MLTLPGQAGLPGQVIQVVCDALVGYSTIYICILN